jgi:hypothetical protein
MTHAEMEAIFGEPGNVVTAEPLVAKTDFYAWFATDRAVAMVQFADGAVTAKQWHPGAESWTDKLRRWLHRP